MFLSPLLSVNTVWKDPHLPTINGKHIHRALNGLTFRHVDTGSGIESLNCSSPVCRGHIKSYANSRYVLGSVFAVRRQNDPLHLLSSVHIKYLLYAMARKSSALQCMSSSAAFFLFFKMMRTNIRVYWNLGKREGSSINPQSSVFNACRYSLLITEMPPSSMIGCRNPLRQKICVRDFCSGNIYTHSSTRPLQILITHFPVHNT
jgi:hypothetical protein